MSTRLLSTSSPDPPLGLGGGFINRKSGLTIGPLNRPIFPFVTDFSDFIGRLQPSKTTIQKTPNALGVEESSSPRRVPHLLCSKSSRGRMRAEFNYGVVINWVQYLGPPGPFSFPDPRDLLSDLRDLLLPRFSGPPRGSQEDFLGIEREPQGGSPRVREDPLGTPPSLSLSAKKVL